MEAGTMFIGTILAVIGGCYVSGFSPAVQAVNTLLAMFS